MRKIYKKLLEDQKKRGVIFSSCLSKVTTEIKALSNKNLISAIQQTEEQINVVEVFGIKDLIYLELLYREADKRGLP